jgi:hypothetical protein
VELQANRTAIKTALRLGQGIVRGVEPSQRIQAFGMSGRQLEHLLVGFPVAIGFLERKHQRARVDLVECFEQLVRCRLQTGRVVQAQVGMSVAEAQVGNVLPQGLDPRQQLRLGVHPALSIMRTPTGERRPAAARTAATYPHRIPEN